MRWYVVEQSALRGVHRLGTTDARRRLGECVQPELALEHLQRRGELGEPEAGHQICGHPIGPGASALGLRYRDEAVLP